jgi:hypothetical protein
MNALQLLKSADRYQIQEEPLDIPLDGDAVIHAKLISPDLFELQEELEDLKKAAYAEGKQKGWHKLPIDEDEWDTELKGFKESKEYKELSATEKAKRLKALNEGKPKNLAEQRAPYKARLRIVRSILPRLLRDSETGEKLFQTPDEISAVSEIIGSNPELMTLLSQAYARLAAKNNKTSEELEEIKNE